MLRVTWEWIALDEAALDVANTVAVSGGVEHDLLQPEDEYERWAAAAATSPALGPEEATTLLDARARVLELREHIREVLRAAAATEPLPEAGVAALNGASRAAPRWPELSGERVIGEHAHGHAVDRLLAAYARSAMRVAADTTAQVRVCGAPSCGMFYRPRRLRQRWCSEQCGNRARVARHYRARRA